MKNWEVKWTYVKHFKYMYNFINWLNYLWAHLLQVWQRIIYTYSQYQSGWKTSPENKENIVENIP